MNNRRLGKSGFKVSEVGLGCWQLGADWGNAINQQRAFEILTAAVDNGTTFFDTADVYGDGQSERVIGEFLRQCDTPIKVATKYGRGGDVYPDNYSEASLRTVVESSLNNLGLDSLDLLQLHCIPLAALQQGEIFDALRKLKKEGLINNFGASVESVEEGLVCLEQEGLASLQVIFNLFRQKLATELLPQAQAKGVGIIVRLPLASGLLSGKFTKQSNFLASDHRNYNRNGECFNVGETFAGLPFELGVALTDQLSLLRPKELSMAEMSLRWILDHPAVSTIIPGASSPEQSHANAAISALPSLTQQQHHVLLAFYNDKVKQHIRGSY